VVAWDSTTPRTAGDEGGSESTTSLDDINDLLSAPPETHSFVLLKSMFYAAKTMEDKHVGILWDRLGGVMGGDNARLQSLLGRACGYNKSKDTIIYTSLDTVTRYLTFWRELCYSVDAEVETADHTASALHRRMPGVVAVGTKDGGVKVGPAKGSSNPIAAEAGNALDTRVRDDGDMSVGPQVPEVIEISDADFARIPGGRAPEEKRRIVLSILARTKPTIAAELEEFECLRVNVPESTTSASYKASVAQAIRKFNAKERCSSTFKAEERIRGKVWQCFVDKHSEMKRLCFVYIK
jgi:hypothetical protein